MEAHRLRVAAHQQSSEKSGDGGDAQLGAKAVALLALEQLSEEELVEISDWILDRS
jgi:hypothetical protein